MMITNLFSLYEFIILLRKTELSFSKVFHPELRSQSGHFQRKYVFFFLAEEKMLTPLTYFSLKTDRIHHL